MLASLLSIVTPETNSEFVLTALNKYLKNKKKQYNIKRRFVLRGFSIETKKL